MMDDSTFEYLKPSDEQMSAMATARAAFKTCAEAIDAVIPDGPDKTYVMRTLRTVAMWTNIAITRQPDGSPRR